LGFRFETRLGETSWREHLHPIVVVVVVVPSQLGMH